jgi:glycosyltransferase involved in cell wall biosynthesis
MAAESPSQIVVTHPGRQHSHQAALGLQQAGMLAGYWAGVPSLERHARGVPRALWRRLIRYAPVPLDPRRARWVPAVPALRQLGGRLPAGAAAEIDFLACRLFDRWAAARLRGAAAQAVIACEISALTTFRQARRLGMTTILDAPSLHRLAQDRLHGTADAPGLHRRIARVKDEEIALADHILTVSELARQTYLDAGVPAAKVHAVPLGADLDLFAPAAPADIGAPRSGFTFLFAGASLHRKGFDLLLEAFARVAAAEPDARLRLVGPRGDAAHLLVLLGAAGSAGISEAGPTDQRGLAAELRQADCLVLPSRNDSYGMVVAESLAAGVPVLISEMVGAKDLVREGENGWIVPVADADALNALVERMLWCVRHRDEVRALAPACRRAAETATWPAYHQRLATLLTELLRR